MACGDFFTVGSTNIATTPMPVQLVDFTASVEKNGVMTRWETQTEINNDYFTVLRSFNGEKFEEVARVPGAGNSNGPLYYQALDKPGIDGTVYYQLKQTDFDGKTSYSEIRKVTLKEVPFSVKLYPNPVDGSEFTTEVPVDTDLIFMQVFNVSGQIVFSATAQGPVTKWNIGDLPKGMYFMKFISDTGVDVRRLC